MNEAELGIEKEAISFYPDHDTKSNKTLEIKFTLSGSSFKTQLPIFREGNAEQLLDFLYEFNQAKQKLGYTNHQKLESGLEQLLQGNARNEWNTIKTTTLPNIQTVAAFAERLTAFKKLYIPEPSAIDNQRNYHQRIRKKDKLSVPQFLDRLKHINMLMSQFPEAQEDDTFTGKEIKKIFYHSMPARWRTNFINSGQNIKSTSLDTLRTYMVQQEMQTDAHQKKVREENKKSQGKTSNSNDKSRSFKRGSNSKPNNNNNNNKSKKPKLTNEDDCPIYGWSHEWGQCHQNQYGDNFKPRRMGSDSTSNTSNYSQTRSRRNSYGNNVPNPIQVYTNEARSQYSESNDNSSRQSRSSNSNFRYPPGYPN